MRFADVLGHDEAKADLRRMVDTGSIPHAILISGRSGIGKMKLARAFASYIHCENRVDGDSCGVCPSCRQAASVSDPDIRYSYPVIKKQAGKPVYSTDYLEEWKQMLRDSPEMDFSRWQLLIGSENKQPVIYVDEADDIIYNANLSSYSHKEKIFIIWLPEKLNVETANKLLKIIEEPFEDTYFVLVSNEPSLLLPTIFSRTRRINLKPLPESVVKDWMVKEKRVSPTDADTFASMAEGSLLTAMEVIGGAGESEEFGDIYRRMMRASYAVAMVQIRDIAEEIAGFGREKIIRLLEYVGRMTRENLILNLQYPALNRMTVEESVFSSRFFRFVNERNVVGMIEETDRARGDVERNANPKIVLFDYMLKLAILLKK